MRHYRQQLLSAIDQGQPALDPERTARHEPESISPRVQRLALALVVIGTVLVWVVEAANLV